MSYLENFTQFLSTVPLSVYREKYKSIKLVEMDLPKNIQALNHLYKIYWDEKRFISFDDFYDEYKKDKTDLLEEFREKIWMCEVCFYKWLPARIYRTWASIVTQIHWWYVAEEVFWFWTISMSEYLDHKWVDFQINYNWSNLNIQVKKITQSREVRREKITKSSLEIINIEYFVPNSQMILHDNKKRDWNYRKPYLDFKKNYLDKDYLKILNNWFVIFSEWLFKEIKNNH